MTEAAGGGGAGAMLRAARERQGLHLAALAAQLKVAPRKLEALEGDRYDELPDATFARALAMSVCRSLKIDPAPVLERLPQARTTSLGKAADGLNAAYRDRPGRGETGDHAPRRHPMLWAAVVLVVLAAALMLLPSGWWAGWWPMGAGSNVASSAAAVTVVEAPASAAAAAAASEPLAAASVAGAESPPAAASVAAAASAPAVEIVQATPGTADPDAEPPAGIAVLRAGEASWVEVVDGGGQVLVQRTLQPGESVGLNGRLPLKLKIGNAVATQLSFRGQPVDLTPSTRDNVARLELK